MLTCSVWIYYICFKFLNFCFKLVFFIPNFPGFVLILSFFVPNLNFIQNLILFQLFTQKCAQSRFKLYLPISSYRFLFNTHLHRLSWFSCVNSIIIYVWDMLFSCIMSLEFVLHIFMYEFVIYECVQHVCKFLLSYLSMSVSHHFSVVLL